VKKLESLNISENKKSTAINNWQKNNKILNLNKRG